MRDIKFRGKFKDRNLFFKSPNDGEWVYGDLVHNAIFYCDNFIDAISTVGDVVGIDKETVGQYTGMKDKNGVEIYEGDVVKRYLSDSDGSRYYILGVVVFDDTDASFKIDVCCDIFDSRDVTIEEDLELLSFSIRDVLDGQTPQEVEYVFEVIGNKYDNPYLLNKQKQ